MRTRLSAIGFGLCVVLLAACSGGGGTPTGPFQNPTPTPTPTPSPTPTPTNTSFRPVANGDAFAYSGMMTETFVRPPIPAGGITPVPNPTNTETLNTAVTQAISVTQQAATTYKFHVVETDSLNNGLKTSTVTSDEVYDYLASGASTDVKLATVSSTTSDNVAYTSQYGAGNGLIDVLPEVAGPILPANTFALSTTEQDPDGAALMRTIAADGSYTESGNDSIGVFISTTENADGSGKYTFPFLVPEDSSYTVSAPSPGPSGSPDQINIVLSVPAFLVEATPAANATPVAIPEPPVPVWYPEPVKLAQQTLTNMGGATLPAACNVPAALTRPANKIVQATTTVDPVFGEIDVNTTTTYTEQGVGAACVQLSDVVTQYYDLSGQTQPVTQGTIGFQNTPLQTTTTTETLGLTNETIIGLTSRGRSPQIADSKFGPLAVHAGIAHFRSVLAKHRAERHHEFYRALRAHIASRIVKGGRR